MSDQDDGSSGSSESSLRKKYSKRERRKDKKRKRSKKRKHRTRHRHEYSSFSDSESDNDSSQRRQHKRKKQQKKERNSRRRKREGRKSSKVDVLEKSMDPSKVATIVVEAHKDMPTVEQETPPQADADVRRERAKRMAPMSKAEYDKQHAEIREVYDEESGRYRLMRGTGEIIERIVSRSDHEAINRTATRGDGSSFARNVYNAASTSRR